MQILGLVGGIASGKSAVAAELAALGAVVLDADEAAHTVINLPEVRHELVARWGRDILLPSGEVDRSAVAGRVFVNSPAGTANRQFLEEHLHPRIRAQFEAALESLQRGDTPMAVIDAPLLLEAGWADICNHLVLVDSPREKRLRRAAIREWTAAEFAAREAAQIPIEEKERRATHRISNLGSRTELVEQVRALWHALGGDAGKT
ncbi:MAG: dephospho-CoA kinase [Pirellulales bacterium]|nr:dephospho-CoA kinase [Pirellulales bacterium]